MTCGNSTRGGSSTGESTLSKSGLSMRGRDHGGAVEDAIKLFSQVPFNMISLIRALQSVIRVPKAGALHFYLSPKLP